MGHFIGAFYRCVYIKIDIYSELSEIMHKKWMDGDAQRLGSFRQNDEVDLGRHEKIMYFCLLKR